MKRIASAKSNNLLPNTAKHCSMNTTTPRLIAAVAAEACLCRGRQVRRLMLPFPAPRASARLRLGPPAAPRMPNGPLRPAHLPALLCTTLLAALAALPAPGQTLLR
jgi:hypothetical protein